MKRGSVKPRFQTLLVHYDPQFAFSPIQMGPVVLEHCAAVCVNAAPLLFQVQQRRQELEQALGIRNT